MQPHRLHGHHVTAMHYRPPPERVGLDVATSHDRFAKPCVGLIQCCRIIQQLIFYNILIIDDQDDL